jgi:cyclic pyranopterin phosphate synthase
MIDPFGRKISYLRVSVTDRCDFRCTYCMAEDMTFLPKADLLTLEELDRLCSAFVAKGVRKLRITGGEPLVRRNVMSLFRSLGRHLQSGALDEITLTTNGSQLARFASDLHAAGVRRVNVSLDTLDPALFTRITRWGKARQCPGRHRCSATRRPQGQDQRCCLAGRERRRNWKADAVGPWTGHGPHADRNNADGGHGRGPD